MTRHAEDNEWEWRRKSSWTGGIAPDCLLLALSSSYCFLLSKPASSFFTDASIDYLKARPKRKGSAIKFFLENRSWRIQSRKETEEDEMVDRLLGVLKVRVLRGVDLAVRDFLNSSDPYVILRMGKQVSFLSSLYLQKPLSCCILQWWAEKNVGFIRDWWEMEFGSWERSL